MLGLRSVRAVRRGLWVLLTAAVLRRNQFVAVDDATGERKTAGRHGYPTVAEAKACAAPHRLTAWPGSTLPRRSPPPYLALPGVENSGTLNLDSQTFGFSLHHLQRGRYGQRGDRAALVCHRGPDHRPAAHRRRALDRPSSRFQRRRESDHGMAGGAEPLQQLTFVRVTRRTRPRRLSSTSRASATATIRPRWLTRAFVPISPPRVRSVLVPRRGGAPRPPRAHWRPNVERACPTWSQCCCGRSFHRQGFAGAFHHRPRGTVPRRGDGCGAGGSTVVIQSDPRGAPTSFPAADTLPTTAEPALGSLRGRVQGVQAGQRAQGGSRLTAHGADRLSYDLTRGVR